MPLLLVPAVADVVPREAGFVMEGREEEAHQGVSLGVIFWMRRGGSQVWAAGRVGCPTGWTEATAMGSFEAG